MKDKEHISKAGDPPVIEDDDELTPEAEAAVANQLPKAEQLNQFEKDMELHDGGNQPS